MKFYTISFASVAVVQNWGRVKFVRAEMIFFVVLIQVKSTRDLSVSVRKWTKQAHGYFYNMQVYITKRDDNGRLKKEEKKKDSEDSWFKKD